MSVAIGALRISSVIRRAAGRMTVGDVTYWALMPTRRGADRPDVAADDHGRSLTARQSTMQRARWLPRRRTGDRRGNRRVVAATDDARGDGTHGGASPAWRGRKPDHSDTARTRGRLHHRAAVFGILVVPVLARFDYGGLARALAPDRGYEVITVDLATPPVAGELRLQQRAPTPSPRRRNRERPAMDLSLIGQTTSAPKGTPRHRRLW